MNFEILEDRDRALAAPCPEPPLGCSALAGQPCTRPDGEGGRVALERFAAHEARRRAAGVRHAPIDSRELRRAD